MNLQAITADIFTQLSKINKEVEKTKSSFSVYLHLVIPPPLSSRKVPENMNMWKYENVSHLNSMICGPFIIIQYLEYCKFCKLDIVSHNLLFGKHWYVEKHKIWIFCKNCDSSTQVTKYWDIEILGWCPVGPVSPHGEKVPL